MHIVKIKTVCHRAVDKCGVRAGSFSLLPIRTFTRPRHAFRNVEYAFCEILVYSGQRDARVSRTSCFDFSTTSPGYL